MLNLIQVRELLDDRSLSKVAEKTGIHYNTLRGIRDGTNDNPTYQVMIKLSEYLTC